jgi:hypothetical protein
MANQKYCRNCGSPHLPDAKFCANCGASFARTAAPSPYTNVERLSRPDVIKARKECERAIEESGGGKLRKGRDLFSTKEELKNYLDSDEEVVFPFLAPFGSHNLTTKGRTTYFHYYIVATTKRLIVLDKPVFGGKIKAVSLPFSEILKANIDSYAVRGTEVLSGVMRHSYLKFTATDGRFIMADRIQPVRNLNIFREYVKSMIAP